MRAGLIALLVAIACGVAWLATLPGEPSYNGKTVTAWLESPAGRPNFPGSEVWYHFGSNAIPILRHALWTRNDISRSARWSIRKISPAWVSRHMADPPPSAVVRARAADALGYIQEPTQPVVEDLIKVSRPASSGLTSPGLVRGRAVAALGNISYNMKPSHPAYPAITEAILDALDDEDQAVRFIATNTLRVRFPGVAARAGIEPR